MISKKSLYYILIINVLLYAVIILIYPGFISDDYLIFTHVSQNPQQLISLNINEPFFLFFRPVSYFTFWVDYHVFHLPWLMKCFSLLIHLGLITVIFQIIKNFSLLLDKKLDNTLLFICLLLFSLHLDVLTWIYWISDRTELLCLFFYSLTILYFIKYYINHKKLYLFFIFIFFLLSILSKQQGAHLPFLFLSLYIFLRIKKKTILDNKFVYVSLAMLTITLIYSYINFSYYSSDLDVISNFYKKPFSLIGNILNTIIPVISWRLYNFFILNKKLALLLLLFFIIIFVIFFIKKKWSIHNILPPLAFLLIISFPRIMAVGTQRINSIYLFWLIVSLYLYFIYNGGKYKRKLISIAMIIYACSFIYRVFDEIVILKNYELETIELKKLVESKPNQKFTVVTAENSEILPYKLFYFRHHSFGYDSTLDILPVYFDRSLIYYDVEKYKYPLIDVAINGDTLKMHSNDELLYFIIDNRGKDFNKILVVDERISQSGRGYKSICIIDTRKQKSNLIYSNGVNWIKL